MPVSVRARARSHTSQILRPVRGRGAPLVPALSLSRKKGNHVTFDVTAANTIRAQRLRAVASTPISEELVDRVRRAN